MSRAPQVEANRLDAMRKLAATAVRPHAPAGDLNEREEEHAMKSCEQITAKIFARRGSKTEVHLSRLELQAMLSLAFMAGMRCGRLDSK